MIVGKLMVVLGLDSTGFNTGLNSATGKTTLFAKASDKAFKLIGAAAKIGMLAVSAAFVKGALDAAKFEKALANVSTMLDKKTMPMMVDFKKGILALSQSYGQSTNTLAKGLYDILSASIPAAQAMDVLESSAQAAVAGLTDTGIAADAITTLMNSFGDATKDANYYSDILFTTVKLGKTTFGELAPVVGNVAKLMQTAGGTAEDMAGMLSIMTRNGIDTRVAITSLRGVVTALLKPSEALTEELGGMTVKADGFAAVMAKVGSLSAVDLAEMFPNVRALTGVVVAAGGLKDELIKINDIMNDGSPTMVAFEKQSQTTAFIWSQFKETLKATSIAIGTELLPQIREILIATTTWLKENKENFANFAKTTLKAITDIFNFVFRFKEAILGLGAALVGIMAFQKATTLMAAFGVATSVSLGPVTAIAVAIGLLIATFFKLRKEMRDLQEQQELVDKGLKGNLSSTEDYSAAIDIQRKKIEQIEEDERKRNAAIAGRSELRGSDSALANEAYNARLEQAKTELRTLYTNEKAQMKIEADEKKRAEDKAAAEQQAFFDDQARIAASNASEEEKAAQQRQLEAERKAALQEAEDQAKADAEAELQRIADIKKAKEDEVASIRNALFLASETEEERYLREKKHYEDLGLSQQEVLDYLAIKYPAALESASEASTEFWDDQEGSAKIFPETFDEMLTRIGESFTSWVDEMKEMFSGLYAGMTGTVSAYFKYKLSVLDEEQSASDKAFKIRMDALDAEEAGGADVADARKALQDEQEAADLKIAKKKHKIAVQQFNYEKAISLSEIAMATAIAVAKAIPNIFLMAAIGILGAVQAGFVLAEKPPPAPTFIRGGVTGMIDGGVFAGKSGIDTNQIAVTNGEYIMPPQQTLDNINELEAMRSGASGGRSVTVNPMPLNINIEGRNVFDATVEFITEGSDRGTFRINPKVLGALT